MNDREMASTLRRISQDLDSRTGDMVQMLRRLVECESPSTDFAAVNRFVSLLRSEMKPMGLHGEAVRVENCPDLLECRHARGGRPIMLLGHTDTVWPTGTLAHMPLRTEGDKLYGPGSYDMKGGIVIALFALQALGEQCPPVDLFLTSQEECGGEPYREQLQLRASECAAVIGLEPAWPGGAVKTERKGCGRVMIRSLGRTAHAGANPEKGVNAIVEVVEQIAALRALQKQMPDGVTLNVGLIRGGTRPNVVPESAEIQVDVRFRKLADGDEVMRRVRELTPVLPGARIEVSTTISAPPLERTGAVLRLFSVARRAGSILGQHLEEVSTGGASEASYTAAQGVPTIDGLGVDGDGAHAADEHAYIPSLPRRAALVAGMLLMLDGQSRSGETDQRPAPEAPAA